MIKKLEVLDSTRHQDLRLMKVSSFEFARKTSLVGLSISEMAKTFMSYPIVFPEEGEEVSPMGILSYVKDTNSYLDEKGNWKTSYVPAYFRLYPFALAKTGRGNQAEGQEEMALCIDRDAPHFESNMGDPLFTADGKPVDFIMNIFNALKQHHQELTATKQIFKKVAETGILQSKELHVQINNQKNITQKFKIIDMEKLKQLDDKILADWARTGIMATIYDHVRSLSHLTSQNRNVKMSLS